MSWGRRGRWLLGALPVGIGLAGLLALVLAAVLDRGPSGQLRLTAFPLALAALDPFVIESARNSLVLATVVAVLSGRLGAWLARLAQGTGRLRPFWIGLVLVPMSLPAVGTALGLHALVRWLNLPPTLGWSALGDDALAWCLAAAAQCGWGVPLVALAASRALDGIDPTWIDAARLAGGRRRAIWRTLVRPLIRPHSARAAGGVFALSLLEPGAPLALGLRRSLPWQLVEAVRTPADLNRAAVLSLLGVGLALLGRAFCRRWGGDLRGTHPELAIRPPRPTRLGLASVGSDLALGVWSLLALLPWVGLVGLVLQAIIQMPEGVGSLAAGLLPRPDDGERVWAPLGATLVVGGLVATLGLALALLTVGPADRVGAILPRGTRWLRGLPPLVPAVGALVGLGLLGGPGGGPIGPGRPFDPHRFPGLLLGAVLLFLHWPALLDAVAEARARVGRSRIEQMRTLGASRWQAWRLIAPRRLAPPLLAGALRVGWLAGCDVAPALVLTADSRCRPVGAALLDLAGAPGAGTAAALLALLVGLIGLLGLSLVAWVGPDALVARPPR